LEQTKDFQESIDLEIKDTANSLNIGFNQYKEMFKLHSKKINNIKQISKTELKNYKYSKTTIQNVIDSKKKVLDAKLGELRIKYEYHRLLFYYYKLIGQLPPVNF
jgi:hypothetical protein